MPSSFPISSCDGVLVLAGAQEPAIRLGMIGLDTPHVIAFTRILNDASREDHVWGQSGRCIQGRQ